VGRTSLAKTGRNCQAYAGCAANHTVIATFAEGLAFVLVEYMICYQWYCFRLSVLQLWRLMYYFILQILHNLKSFLHSYLNIQHLARQSECLSYHTIK
jgi:hypothetical protein